MTTSRKNTITTKFENVCVCIKKLTLLSNPSIYLQIFSAYAVLKKQESWSLLTVETGKIVCVVCKMFMLINFQIKMFNVGCTVSYPTVITTNNKHKTKPSNG